MRDNSVDEDLLELIPHEAALGEGALDDGLEGMSDEKVADFAGYFKEAQLVSLKVLDQLPEQVLNQMCSTARRILEWRLRYRMMLKVAQTRRQKAAQKIVRQPTATFFHASGVFRSWPMLGLTALAKELRPLSVDAGEYVYYAGEPNTSGVVLLTSGTVHESHRPARGEELMHLAVHTAPAVLGDTVQVTGEAHGSYISAAVACECWTLTRAAFAAEYEKLPENLRELVHQSVLVTRETFMLAQLPVTPAILRASTPLLASATERDLQELIVKMVPKVLPPGTTIAHKDQIPASCHLLRRGVALLVDGEFADKPVKPLSMISDFDMFFREKRSATVVTKTPCYLYSLSESDFSDRQSLTHKVREAACDHRKRVMDRSVVVPSLRTCPLFQNGYPGLLSRVAELFQPLVLTDNELLASTSQQIDAMFIVSRGTVRVRNINTRLCSGEDLVHPKECIGYTGLVQQRWAFPIAASGLAECWALPFDAFVPHLKEHGHLAWVVKRSKDLFAQQAAKEVNEARTDDGAASRKEGHGLWRSSALGVKCIRRTKAATDESGPIDATSAGKRAGSKRPRGAQAVGAMAPALVPSMADRGGGADEAVCSLDSFFFATLRSQQSAAPLAESLSVESSFYDSAAAVASRPLGHLFASQHVLETRVCDGISPFPSTRVAGGAKGISRQGSRHKASFRTHLSTTTARANLLIARFRQYDHTLRRACEQDSKRFATPSARPALELPARLLPLSTQPSRPAPASPPSLLSRRQEATRRLRLTTCGSSEKLDPMCPHHRPCASPPRPRRRPQQTLLSLLSRADPRDWQLFREWQAEFSAAPPSQDPALFERSNSPQHDLEAEASASTSASFEAPRPVPPTAPQPLELP
eukprot:gene8966-13885_t